jgi:hypothetical protein
MSYPPGLAVSDSEQRRHTVETPAPNPSDSEDVVTALETAAIFAQKGNAAEAAHWLLRAAEGASQRGDSPRASVLARAAAELDEPFAPSSLLEEDAEPKAERRLPTAPARISVRPPPPSARAASQPTNAQPTNDPQPMLLVRPASTPTPAAVKSNPAPTSVKPAAASVRPVPATSTASTKSTPAPASVRPGSVPSSQAALAPSVRPMLAVKDHHEESAVRPSSPSASAPGRASESPALGLKAPLHTERHRPFRLQGSRASIAASQGSSRFYVLKVLDDDEPVPEGEQEAYIVLVPPKPSR